MKFFMKLMMSMTVLALAGPFFLKGPDGRPLMNVTDLGLGKLSGLLANVKSLAPQRTSEPNVSHQDPHLEGLALVNGDQVYYRWQDENGVWQFTAEPPPSHTTDYQPVITNPNANVIQSLRQDQIDNALGRSSGAPTVASSQLQKKQSKTAELSQELEALSSESGLPLTNVPKLIEQTKQIRSTMEQRNKTLDQL